MLSLKVVGKWMSKYHSSKIKCSIGPGNQIWGLEREIYRLLVDGWVVVH